MLGKGICHVGECPWESTVIDYELAQELTVAHVIIDHPEEYRDKIGKEPPEIDQQTQFYLEVYTTAKEA